MDVSQNLNKDLEVQLWVGSTRLAVIAAAHPRNVLCQPDSCHSLTLEHRFVAGPARGTTGQNTTFSLYGNRAPMAATEVVSESLYYFYSHPTVLTESILVI